MFLLRGCSIVTSLRFNNLKPITKVVRFDLTTTPARRKRSNNHRMNRRNGHYRLLDKFLKNTSLDGSLIVRAPMNLRCSASFFDKDNNLDSVKNYNVGLSREEANRLERLNRRKGVFIEEDNAIENNPVSQMSNIRLCVGVDEAGDQECG